MAIWVGAVVAIVLIKPTICPPEPCELRKIPVPRTPRVNEGKEKGRGCYRPQTTVMDYKTFYSGLHRY